MQGPEALTVPVAVPVQVVSWPDGCCLPGQLLALPAVDGAQAGLVPGAAPLQLVHAVPAMAEGTLGIPGALPCVAAPACEAQLGTDAAAGQDTIGGLATMQAMMVQHLQRQLAVAGSGGQHLGQETKEAHSAQGDSDGAKALALQCALEQAYFQATQVAKSLGYYSLEAMELHKAAISRAQTRGGQRQSNPCTVFVGGLTKNTADEKVKEHFSKYGEVTRVDVIRSLEGASRGFAFVKFSDAEAVDRCLDAKFDHVIDDKWVNVKRKDSTAGETGKNANRAVKMAAASVGVEPSQYLNYLTHVATVRYGYGRAGEQKVSGSSSSTRPSPY